MFPFESANGALLKLITASKGAPMQVAERWVMRQKLSFMGGIIHLPRDLDTAFKSFLHGRTNHQDGVLGAAQEAAFSALEEAALTRFFYQIPPLEKYLRACIRGLSFKVRHTYGARKHAHDSSR